MEKLRGQKNISKGPDLIGNMEIVEESQHKYVVVMRMELNLSVK